MNRLTRITLIFLSILIYSCNEEKDEIIDKKTIAQELNILFESKGIEPEIDLINNEERLLTFNIGSDNSNGRSTNIEVEEIRNSKFSFNKLFLLSNQMQQIHRLRKGLEAPADSLVLSELAKLGAHSCQLDGSINGPSI